MISYTINFTSDTKTPFVIPPGEYNGPNHLLESPPRPTKAHTSLNLPGAGTIRYGEMINEDLVHILENFYNDTPPPLPTYGQIWTSTNDHMHVYASSDSWTRMPVVNPDPAKVMEGDIQIVDGRVYIYGGGQFIEISTSGSSNNPCAVTESVDWGFTANNLQNVVVDWGLTTDIVTEVADWGGRCVNDVVVDWGYTNQPTTRVVDWGEETNVNVAPSQMENWGYTVECQPAQSWCMHA